VSHCHRRVSALEDTSLSAGPESLGVALGVCQGLGPQQMGMLAAGFPPFAGHRAVRETMELTAQSCCGPFGFCRMLVGLEAMRI
jgi:hypothetical protein